MDFKKNYSRNYGLEQHVYDMTRWADIKSPHRCSVVVDVLCQWEDCKIPRWTGCEALKCLILDILDYLWKDPYLFNLWYKAKLEEYKIDARTIVDTQHELIDLIKQLMYDNWCEKVEETLYNYAD